MATFTGILGTGHARRIHRKQLAAVRLDPEDVAYAHEVVRAALPAVLERLDAAGYDGDFKLLGAGMTAVMLLNTRTGEGLKVAHDSFGARILFGEYEFLTSMVDSPVAKHLPEVYAFDPSAGVLVREAVAGRVGTMSTPGLFEVYERITREARKRHWTKPEYKEDSFVVEPDGNIVMVDVGFTNAIGPRLAAKIEAVLESGQDISIAQAEDWAWELRMDVSDGVLPATRADEIRSRLEQRVGKSLE